MYLLAGVIMFLPLLSANPVFHSRTKHLEVDYQFIRERVLHKDLSVGFILGKDNLADVFIKPLLDPPFLLIRSKLLVDSSPCRLRGYVEGPPNSVSSVFGQPYSQW